MKDYKIGLIAFLLMLIMFCSCSSPESKYRNAQNLLYQDEITEANEIAEKLVADYPSNYNYLVLLGRCQQRFVDNDEKAIRTFQRALQLETKNDSLPFFLGLSYYTVNKYDSSSFYYSKFAAYNPNSYETWGMLGACSRDSKDYSNAINLFNRSLSINSENAHTYIGLGICYSQSNEHKKALENYKIALIKIFNNFTEDKLDLIRRIANSYCYLDKPDSAISILKSVLRPEEFEPTQIYFDLASIYDLKLNNLDSSNVYYEKAKNKIEEDYITSNKYNLDQL